MLQGWTFKKDAAFFTAGDSGSLIANPAGEQKPYKLQKPCGLYYLRDKPPGWKCPTIKFAKTESRGAERCLECTERRGRPIILPKPVMTDPSRR